jgi:predicted dehydrogenase
MTDQVGVVLWGVGSHARKNVIPALRKAEGVRVVGVFSRDEDSRLWASEELECQAFDSAEQALSSDDVEAVYLAVPPIAHYEIGSQIVRSGRHLWCEKPLTLNLQEARELADTASRLGVGIFETFMYRHHPQFTHLRDLIGSGRLGAIRAVEATFGIPHLASDDHRYSRAMGGGSLADAGCYPVSFALTILGESIDVCGVAMRFEAGYEVDVQGAATLVDPDHAVAQISWGFGLSYRNEAVVWGSEGYVRIPRAFSKAPGLGTVLTTTTSDGTDDRIEVEAADHFVLMVQEFAQDIRLGQFQRHTDEAVRQASLISTIRSMPANSRGRRS